MNKFSYLRLVFDMGSRMSVDRLVPNILRTRNTKCSGSSRHTDRTCGSCTRCIKNSLPYSLDLDKNSPPGVYRRSTFQAECCYCQLLDHHPYQLRIVVPYSPYLGLMVVVEVLQIPARILNRRLGQLPMLDLRASVQGQLLHPYCSQSYVQALDHGERYSCVREETSPSKLHFQAVGHAGRLRHGRHVGNYLSDRWLAVACFRQPLEWLRV